MHFPFNLPPARTAPNKLVNALVNPAINARAVMPDGRRLEADGTENHREPQKGAYLCL